MGSIIYFMLLNIPCCLVLSPTFTCIGKSRIMFSILSFNYLIWLLFTESTISLYVWWVVSYTNHWRPHCPKHIKTIISKLPSTFGLQSQRVSWSDNRVRAKCKGLDTCKFLWGCTIYPRPKCLTMRTYGRVLWSIASGLGASPQPYFPLIVQHKHFK